MQDEYSNEIAVMKELDHPNLVKLYEVIHDPSNNKLLMTMEYVEGGCVLISSSSGNDKVCSARMRCTGSPALGAAEPT